MKHITALIIVCVIGLSGFLLNFHVIRFDSRYDLIAKDHMSLRETYVDARGIPAGKLMTFSPRIRNYLIYRLYYEPAIESVKAASGESAKTIKDQLRKSEQALHEWLKEILK